MDLIMTIRVYMLRPYLDVNISFVGKTTCISCSSKCSTIPRLFDCDGCVQAKPFNCIEGQYIPVYSCTRS